MDSLDRFIHRQIIDKYRQKYRLAIDKEIRDSEIERWRDREIERLEIIEIKEYREYRERLESLERQRLEIDRQIDQVNG